MFDAYEAVDELIDDINEDYYESCYDAIYEELCDRVEYGELTLEEAEMINEAAAEKYITEFKSDIKRHYEERLAKERLTHNHDEYLRSGGGGYLRYNLPDKSFKKSEDEFKRKWYDHGFHTKSLAYDNFIHRKLLNRGGENMELNDYKVGKGKARGCIYDARYDVFEDHERNKKESEYKQKLKKKESEIIKDIEEKQNNKTNEKNQGKQIAKIAAGATAAAAAGALIISKSQKASMQKSFKNYISTHDNVIPFNEFKSEKITDSDIKKYAPNLVSKAEDMLTVTKGKKYTYNGQVQCLYIEMRAKTTQNSGPRKPHFVLVSPICNKHDEYYIASMCYSNKVKDPMLKRFLKNNK